MSPDAPHAIRLLAELKKISNAQDGGWKFTMEVPESETPSFLELSTKLNRLLRVTIVEEEL